ncbi:unnamed protein product [Calypogeia fissa]
MREAWTLENTPTWAVAFVCTTFVAIGLLMVRGLEKIEKKLRYAKRKHLKHALQKLKEELMLLGFISLLLTVCHNYVSSICVKVDVMEHWSPCRVIKSEADHAAHPAKERRKLLALDSWPMTQWRNDPLFRGRILSESAPSACRYGHSSLLSSQTLHQMHIFIFVLAGVHVVDSLFAMLLASWKVSKWKAWEEEAHGQDPPAETLNEAIKSQSVRKEAPFIKHYTSEPSRRNWLVLWIICFFRQFGQSVERADYLVLRLGFIATHNAGHKFDFHTYMVRTIEDDYETVVGISVALWVCVIIYMLFNVFRTNLFFWLSIVPGLLVLVVGAKLQHVIATLALESAGFTPSGQKSGKKSLKLRDELFWFRRPMLMLNLIHFILFQNAFEIASILSFLWLFGWNSCLLSNKPLVYTRLALGFVIQIICSYSTLPLYALASQMGSYYKKAIFQDNVKEEIHLWRYRARKRLRSGAVSCVSFHSLGDEYTSETKHDLSEDGTRPETKHDLSKDDTRPEPDPTPELPLVTSSAGEDCPICIDTKS